jgi:hypothetical protein
MLYLATTRPPVEAMWAPVGLVSMSDKTGAQWRRVLGVWWVSEVAECSALPAPCCAGLPIGAQQAASAARASCRGFSQ